MKTRWSACLIVLALLAIAGFSLWHRHQAARLESRVADLAQSAQASQLEKLRSATGSPRQTAAAKPYLPPDFPTSAHRVMDARLGYWERAAALKQFAKDLSQTDAGALTAFLKSASPADSDAWARALKNAVLDHLCEIHAPGLPRLLAQIYENQAEDAVVRDYALQHLIEYQQALIESGAGTDGGLKASSAVLWSAVKEPDGTLAGTALLGLSRWSEITPAIDRQQVAATALELASDSQAGDLTRTTAMQVCGRMGVTNALPAIWQAAQAGGTLPLQVSAIAALGLLNDRAAMPFLEQLVNGDEDSLKPAARQSLAQLAENERQHEAWLQEQREKPIAEEFERQKARNHARGN